MPRNPKPTDLTINVKSVSNNHGEGPNSSPIGVDLSSFGGDFSGSQLTSLPPLPSSPPLPTSPKHHRDPSKNLLSSFKNRAQPEQEQQRSQGRQARETTDDAYRPGSSSMSKIYHLRKNPGSTPELSLLGSAENVGKAADEDGAIGDSRPQPSLHHSEDSIASKRKDKSFRNPLSRSKSIRRDSKSREQKPSFDQPPKTAPLSQDWAGTDMGLLRAKGKDKDKRGKSAERAPVGESTERGNLTDLKSAAKDKDKEKEKSGGFMSGGKNVVSKATKGGGNLFTRLGKIGRSSSDNEKKVPDNEYVLKVINRPLVEQTRLTRISKDLASCRDKTEYWMPALPWRCIDYLNLNCESEGLYRVPGSGPQVKSWQRRFDTELDIDLLDATELYDPNNIGSMLKSWLRDLPTEIMPTTMQNELAAKLEKENPHYMQAGQSAPQLLRDALSGLSPYNYYLLFAITCHLSLLLSHKDKNKMDLNNLSICIGPCLKLDRWLFNYLVGDWRHCWQGCYTEKQYLEAERAWEQGIEYHIPGMYGDEEAVQDEVPQDSGVEERAASSGGSANGTSKPGSHYEDARPVLHEENESQSQSKKQVENKKPETYRPAVARIRTDNSSTTPPTRSPAFSGTLYQSHEVRRPATAEGEEKTNPPRLHQRSRSDVPSTPVKSNNTGPDPLSPMPEQS